MGSSPGHIKRFYRRHIHPYDPSFLTLRRSLKTLTAMAICLWIYWPYPQLLAWGPLAAFTLSQVPPGLPLAARRKAMLLLVAAAALLVIPSSLAGYGVFLPTVFIVLATLAAFGAAALGPAYGACALWALLLVVVALGKPAPLEEGLQRALAVALGGGVCWAMHFLVWPMRARQLYRSSLTMALVNLEELWDTMRDGYPTGRVDQNQFSQIKEQALKALHRLRGLPQFLETPPDEEGSPATAILILGLDLVRVYENLLALWQLRQEALDSALFDEYGPRLAGLMNRARDLLGRLRRAVQQNQGEVDASGLIHELTASVEQLRQRKADDGEHSIGEYVLVFNSLTALLALTRDLGRAEGQRRAVELLNPPSDKAAPSLSGFWARLKAQLGPGSAIPRSAGQAAVAAGASMLLVKATDLHNGYWVVLFALLMVKPDLGTTMAMGKRRLLGTCLGAAGAIVFLLGLGDQGPVYYLASGAGAFATLYLMSFPLAVLSGGMSSFTMIMITSTVSPLGWAIGLLRVGEVALAVGIGLTTARFLWPNRASRRVRGEAATVYQGMASFLDQAVAGYLAGGLAGDRLSGPRQELQDQLSALKASYAAAGREPGRNPSLGRHFGEVISHASRMFDQLLVLEAAASRGAPLGPWQAMSDQVRALGSQLSQTVEALGKALAGATRPPRPPDLAGQRAKVRAALRQFKASSGELAGQGRLTLSSFLWELGQLEHEALAAREEVAALARD
ncbi:MAG: FUSC family protein [Desulfarculaceae bacterium]|nr:FUSC family protein [Desulfarculaceae bacterium]